MPVFSQGFGAVPDDSDYVHAGDAQEALRKLGFYSGPSVSVTGREALGKEWDSSTVAAFDAWARARGLHYELLPDPDPLDADFPRSFVLISPLAVSLQLFDESTRNEEVYVPATAAADGTLVVTEDQQITTHRQPAFLVIAGAAVLGGLAWATGAFVKKRRRRKR